MQNAIQKFRQSSIVFEKPVILSENLKTLMSSNYLNSSIFFAETSHTFSTYHFLKKGVWDFLSYFQKLKETWFLHTRFLQDLQI